MQSCNEKFERKIIFLVTLIHIGALCTKTLTHIWQSLWWSKSINFCIFPYHIFQNIQNLPGKVGKDQFRNFESRQ